MRYFFVSYFDNTGSDGSGFGNIIYSSPNFLSAIRIIELIREIRKKQDINPIILNVQEMNGIDYKEFIKK